MTALSWSQVAIEQAICNAIATVYKDTGRPAVAPTATMLLGADLGFDSLDLAHCVVLLEQRLGVDPFRRHTADYQLRTVADLTSLYVATLSCPRTSS